VEFWLIVKEKDESQVATLGKAYRGWPTRRSTASQKASPYRGRNRTCESWAKTAISASLISSDLQIG